MELVVQSQSGKSSKLSIADAVFACEFNEGLVHQVLTAYKAGGRQGSKAQKSRSDVRGGGKKPWRQKGTGRARAGTSNSPIWRGGGVTFAATPRDYSQKVNKKMYRRAMAAILSELIRQERMQVIDTISLETHKTRALLEQLQQLKLENVLIVSSEENKNLDLASRNLPHVDCCQVMQLNPVDLIAYDTVLLTVDAVKKLEERLA